MVDIALVDEIVEVGNFQKFCPRVIFVPYCYSSDTSLKVKRISKYKVSFIGRTDRRNRSEFIEACKTITEVHQFGVGSEKGVLSDIAIEMYLIKL